MKSAPYIDPEELPFTTDEVYRAASLWLSDADARAMAESLAERGPNYIAERKQRRARWSRAGVPNAERLPLSAWGYPEWLLPALTVLTASCETRTRLLIGERWASHRRAYLQEIQAKAAEAVGLRPTREQVIAELDRETRADTKADARRGLVVQFPALPEPTPAMVEEAESRVEEEVRAWEALMHEARQRLRERSGAVRD